MRRAAIVLLAAWLGGTLLAAATPSAPELDAIRADLASARFEAVVAAATSLLARPDLPAEQVAEALVLRSQARVGQGDLAKAEEDWRRLLVLEPSYAPDAMTTGRKALDRFDKVQRSVVGTVRFVVDPPDAEITLEGKPLRLPIDGTVRLAAGSRRIAGTSPGFDVASLAVEVVAGEVTPVEIRLVPNARRVVVRTDLDDVEVRLEGRLLGRTRRDAAEGAASVEAASLTLEPLPLGEHLLELRKECYRAARVEVSVSVDVLDHAPLLLPVATLDPARADVTFSGAPTGAEILWGGEKVATLPSDGPVSLCAGTRRLEARVAGRVVWRGIVEVPEEGEAVFDIAPRPNAALVGAERWPDDLAALATSFGTIAGLPIPEGADLATVAGWNAVSLPPDTDLAVAVVPGGGSPPKPASVFLYSPWLGTIERIVAPAAKLARPTWRERSFGWTLAESRFAGGVVVAEAIAGGPAAAAGIVAGSRLTAIGGKEIRSLAEARAALGSAEVGAKLSVSVAAAGDGETRTVAIAPSLSPTIREPGEEGPAVRATVAAFAAVDGAATRDAAALGTLGAMLLREGRPDRAVEILRRARFEPRAGIGAGTISYLLGRGALASGQETEAREAFQKARQSSATAFSDEGPAVAPAAADHLADLGVTVR